MRLSDLDDLYSNTAYNYFCLLSIAVAVHMDTAPLQHGSFLLPRHAAERAMYSDEDLSKLVNLGVPEKAARHALQVCVSFCVCCYDDPPNAPD